MRIDFGGDSVAKLDIAAPPRWRIPVTAEPALPADDLAQLTDGQKDCLRLVFQHMTSKDIARVLGVSPHTVDMRLRTAMKVLSVASRIDAARLLVNEEGGSDAYQPLIYQAPDVALPSSSPENGVPASPRSDEHESHDPSFRFRPVVGPPASGPPRLAGASTGYQGSQEHRYQTEYPANPGADLSSVSDEWVGSRPWGKRNNLGVGARLGWIFLIAIGSALGFGAVLAALAALKTLL